MTAVVTPIDEYLAAQQDLTAVERFARRHDDFAGATITDEQRWYADRLPATPPGPGQQYAFRVDLDLCTGCKACVAACHSLNGLDEGESWRTVGALVGPDRVQTVPSGCHHCVEPACLAGCPTNAYEKDPITGIVRHLDDQCIGCSYCELTCPYEVPALNERLGIVRKCDMCAGRLAAGEAPACVQACPTSAITITVVDQQSAVVDALHGSLVPGAPSSTLTTPTTVYASRTPLDETYVAADHHAVHLSRSHPPLVALLVLTQISVGALLALLATGFPAGPAPDAGAVGAAVAGLLALAASVHHLGRPLMAWRAVLGLGHSWLSREILAFGVYAGAAVGAAATAALDIGGSTLPRTLAVVAAVSGVGGVGCSILIYVATRRAWWRPRHTIPKFVLTAVVGGSLLEASILLASGHDVDASVSVLCAVAAAATAVKLAVEATFLRAHRAGSDATALDEARSRRLLTGPLRTQTQARFAAGVVGGVLLPLVALGATGPAPSGLAALTALALVVAAAGELIERYQFFVASVAPRMPGSYRP